MSYGGQALIEGVMIRGKNAAVLAVRNPEGLIEKKQIEFSRFYKKSLLKIPVLRGILNLADSLVVGTRALNFSAMIAEGKVNKSQENKSEGVFMLPVPKAGILKNVGRIEEALKIDGIEDIEITIPVGRKVVPLPEGNQYLGFMFAKGKDPSSVESSLREAFSILELEIQ